MRLGDLSNGVERQLKHYYANESIGIARAAGAVNLSNNDVSFNGIGVLGAVSSNTNNRFTSNGAGGTITPIGGVTNPTGLQ